MFAVSLSGGVQLIVCPSLLLQSHTSYTIWTNVIAEAIELQ
jgi:hypothetical protein